MAVAWWTAGGSVFQARKLVLLGRGRGCGVGGKVARSNSNLVASLATTFLPLVMMLSVTKRATAKELELAFLQATNYICPYSEVHRLHRILFAVHQYPLYHGYAQTF